MVFRLVYLGLFILGTLHDWSNWLSATRTKLSYWRSKVARRPYVRTPKYRERRRACDATICRVDGDIVRAKVHAAELCVPGCCPFKKFGLDCNGLHIGHVAGVVYLDLYRLGWLFYGSTLVIPKQGMTQGSGLAPAICNLAFVYLEVDALSRLKWST